MISVAQGGLGDMGGKGHVQPAAAASAAPDDPALREHAREELERSHDHAREELVRSHMPLARALARRLGGRGDELEDLVQVGALGLVKASARFDPGRGVAFGSFAAPAVAGEIRRYLRGARDGVSFPVEATSAGQLGDELESTAGSEYRVLLAGGMRTLDERERRIVLLRFHGDMTEREIAKTVGISQAHVSRLLEGALTKLRTELAGSIDPEMPSGIAESSVISPPASTKIGLVRAQGERVGADSKRTNRSLAQTADAPASEPPARDTTSAGRKSGRGKAAAGYSGRILVRMPSELHEQLAQAAEREDVSLNRYVTQTLSGSVVRERDDAPLKGRTLRLALATNFAIVVVAAVVAVVLLVLALERGL